MESTERLVQTWMATGRDEEINEVISDISNDRLSLISVVKALGEYLTSEDSTLLQKGVEFLALVVGKIPEEKWNRQSVRVLTTFFCGKLDDTVTIKPALSGLSTLATLSSITPSEVTTIVEALIQHVKMKSIVQDVRFKVFSVIDSFMAFHRDVLKSMGKKFLDGYISLAEGEKDPRNLIVAFAIARVILIEFDIHERVESMFNILFCYFPITFRPPPNDRYGISTDDLRKALRNCLNATPAFGPLAIPVFLEKISAGSRATKKDALQTLGTCLPVYGSALARVSARKLWNALKLEIFQPVDQETEEEALKATQILVKTIYADEEAAVEFNEDIQGLARNVCEECLQILKEPEKSQAKPATKILGAFMLTTPSVAKYTISQTIPHLVQLFHNPDEASTRTPTLFLLSELIIAARHSATKSSSSGIDPPLSPFKDDVLGVLTTGLKLSGSRLAALSGLTAMVSTPHLFSDEELGFIVHHVNEILEDDEEGFFDESDTTILGLLTTISEIAPRHVSEQVLPSLFSLLTDSPPTREDVAGRQKHWRVLSTLSKLCIQAELFENLVIRLTTKLDIICFPSPQRLVIVSADPEPSAAYVHVILKTLAQALEIKSKKRHPDIPKYLDHLVPHLFNIFVALAFRSDKQPVGASEERLIQVAGQIINLVVQSTPLQRQQSYSISLSKALLNGDVTDIAQGFQKIDKASRLSIFTGSSPSAQRNLVALLSSAVIALRPEVRLPIEDIIGFLDMLLEWALGQADNDLQRLSVFHILSSILNRRADELSSFISSKLNRYWWDEIASQDVPLSRRRLAIISWIWITKALLVRKHAQAIAFAERLYGAFGDETIGWEAAKAVGAIPSADSILTKANHAEVKVLYVQRYVGAVLPRIIALSKDSSDSTRQMASIVALTSLIKSIPRAAYGHEMPVLIPLLLRGLEFPDQEIRGNIIDTFLAAAEGESPDHSLVSEHSVTLVNSMLKNCTVTETSLTRVRISALRYLAVLPKIIRYDILHPYKASVLRELAGVLDDPKRSVRKEAVDARTNWFKYKGS
ncbi:Dos2-interacting transcription regulator of RNA-Pol-II-domain-containing protein [Gymnopilus junonius]|uniref:MMS19 nucleotide excision repair protein n=1 Tax=Gymnopilus junonius TaxID=109634 RepID=A0A9P5TTA8_GYMJU|nr:Dos2-interacting transcription regulator of RNA-Pol-II-domain-containing protein [Gymnopilus junonius]